MGCRNIRCTIGNWILGLYLAQGLVLAAIGLVGVITSTCSDVDSVRMKGIHILLICFACFHLLPSLFYIITIRPCNTENKEIKIFIAYFLWGCLIGGLTSYQAVQTYEYNQAFTPDVLYTIIMTGLVDLVVIIINALHIVKFCRNEENDELPEKLVED
ncbi:uncharacterized protein LOC132720306 [Ruditapes philippinarum]|uniref:uncharacterized protein LOC132720306 n=1 Tax=Ruditapes philippinarum TaxID=129788 RepID=UPI00295A6A09|nr:uncharacterized protein LOC132720306 [Ruditapes philippinarum]XP_060560409.1 uncharacterized protein LOC132720306 [Ruditapes philippinarum]